MLAEEGDDLSSIEIPSNLGPEGSSSSKPLESESKQEPERKIEAKEEKSTAPEPKKEEKKAESSSAPSALGSPGSTEGKGAEQEKAGGGHKEIRHPQPLFPSVARL